MLNIQTRHTVHKILAALRDGDFTHPGEIEAIDLMMKNVTKDNDQNILDIGSGLGGTTDYLNNNGFGNAIGIDIDSEHIHYASKKYPDSYFIAADVLHAANFLGIHKETARDLAARGELPGAKVGRAWRFLEEDLVTYLRSLYSNHASQGGIDHRSKKIWHSINVTGFGGLTSPTKAREYEKALKLQ